MSLVANSLLSTLFINMHFVAQNSHNMQHYIRYVSSKSINFPFYSTLLKKLVLA
jgi:hypothetical protein